MTLPSRNQQIDAVAKFLDSDRNEGRSLKEIATEIVDGYHEFLLKGVGQPAVPLRRGMLIKTPFDGKVRRVAWMSEGIAWIVSETGGQGWLGNPESHLWLSCEDFRPRKRIDGKMIEMTDEMIEEAWSNPDWAVGDRISQHQREFIHEVIATAPSGVLLRNIKTGSLNADSNSNLEKYYKREVKEVEW